MEIITYSKEIRHKGVHIGFCGHRHRTFKAAQDCKKRSQWATKRGEFGCVVRFHNGIQG